MADPATQFQPGGMGIGYQSSFEPLRLNPPIQLQPADWGQVGRMALAAGQQIQNSALNPAVREQMKYAFDNFKRGEDQIAWNRAMGPYGYMIGSTGPEGFSQVAPGTTGVNPQIALQILAAAQKLAAKQAGKQVEENPPPPKAGEGNDPGDDTGSEESIASGQTDVQTDAQGHKVFYNPATSNWEPVKGQVTTPNAAAPPKSVKPSDNIPTKDPGDLLEGQVTPGTRNLAASTDHDSLIRQMIQERQAAGLGGSEAAQAGTPPDLTFTNPATGNVQPLQQTAPSMFAGRAATPPAAAPSAQTQPPAQQPADQGSAISQITQQPGVALANWQNQNIHPVIAPPALQQALVDNVSTKFKNAHVTYQPGGGVNGEPSFGIDLKDGGHSTLSLSQLASTPWGRSLIQGQNAGQAMQAQVAPPQTNQPGNMLLQPGQQGNAPPPAPAGLLPGQPQIAQGGQAPGPTAPPAPPGPQAYNPAPYQMPQGPTITQAGNVNPALMAGGTNEQAAAAAEAAAPPGYYANKPDYDPNDFTSNVFSKGYSMADLKKMNEDPLISENFAGFRVYQDRRYGTFYSVEKSPSSILHEGRYIWGSPGWQDMPMENSEMRQTLMNMRSNTPMLAKLKDAQIRDMPISRVAELLNAGALFHSTAADSQGPIAQHIQGTINQSQSLARLIDLVEAAKKAGIDPREYSGGQEEFSQNAATAGQLEPAPEEIWTERKDPFGTSYLNTGAAWHAFLSSWFKSQAGARGQTHPLVDELTREAQYWNDQMAQTKGITYSPQGKAEQQPPATFEGWGVRGSIPLPHDKYAVQQVQRVFQNQPPDEVLDGLRQVKARTDQDLVDSVDTARRGNYRNPPEYRDAVAALKAGKDIPDLTNKARDLATGEIRLPDTLREKPRIFNSQGDVEKYMQNGPPDSPFMYDAGDGRGPIKYWTAPKSQ